MALITCKECGNEISSAASACPHCGAPVEKKARCKAAGILFNLLAILSFIGITYYLGWVRESPLFGVLFLAVCVAFVFGAVGAFFMKKK